MFHSNDTFSTALSVALLQPEESYHYGLSDLCLDDWSQNAQVLIYLSANFRCGKAAVQVQSEDYFEELSVSGVLPWPFTSPVRRDAILFSR